MIRLQTAHARRSTSSAEILRRRQIMLQRRVVQGVPKKRNPHNNYVCIKNEIRV